MLLWSRSALRLGARPFCELLEGIVVDLGREQGPEAGDVLLEDLERRRLDPVAAEADPRRLLAQVRACVRRVSMDCWKRPIRVSRHSRLPKSSGELTAAASTGPATAWATL